MISNRPKRHHYIPQMLLKNFLDDNGRFWVFDKIEGKLHQCTPRNTFVQKNLYRTSNLDHENYSYEAEEELSRIESRAAHAVRRIIEQVRCKQPPQLNSRDGNNWKRFMLAIARRTPESRARIVSHKSFEDTFYEAAKKVAEKENYMGLPDKVSIFQDSRISKFKDIIKSNVDATFAAGDHPRTRDETERFCRETGLYVAVICMPKRSFVIGSHGLSIVQPDHKDNLTPGSWLPIAHDVAVAPTAFPHREFLLRIDHDRDSIIERINRASAAQSRIIAGRSKALICSLMQ